MESIVQQKTFQKKLENAVKDKKGRPLGEDLEELTNIVFQKLKEGKNPISSTPKQGSVGRDESSWDGPCPSSSSSQIEID